MGVRLEIVQGGQDIPLGNRDNVPSNPASRDDATSAFPPPQYWNLPATSVTELSYGNNQLKLTGAGSVNPDIITSLSQSYQYSDVNVTQSGHIIEYNDTPGGERVLVKHASGAGVDMLPDGSMILSAANKQVLTVAADQTIIVHGNVSYQVKGDFNLDVEGDFNVNALNMNVAVQQDETKFVGNASRTTIDGNHATTVKSNQSNTVLGSKADTILGNTTVASKGTTTLLSQGDLTVAGAGNAKLTAASGFDISGDNVNVAGNSTSVVGASGTIGGQGVVIYGQGATFGEGVTAPTFSGDLQGTAEFAERADVTNSQNYPANQVGSAAGYSAANTATPTTALPTSALMSEYLNVGSKGIVNVTIDASGEIVRMIDKTQDTGGLSKSDLTTAEVRSKLRDPANRNNQVFVGGQIGRGVLSTKSAQTTPASLGRTVPASPSIVAGFNRFGNAVIGETGKVHRPAPIPVNKRFAPDPQFVIKSDTAVTGATKLSRHYRVNNFTGKSGLNHVTDASERRQIARNLQIHASIMERFLNGTYGLLDGYTLTVVEGIYKEGPEENVTTGDIKDLAKSGRAVVYELVDDTTGQISNEMTYDLAAYWKDTLLYDKLILDYDTYDPSGELNAQIIVLTPQLDNRYRATYDRQLETRFNNNVVANTDIVEVLNADGDLAVGDFGNSATANTVSPGYPEGLTQGEIEQIIVTEANRRNINPAAAVRIFRAEGAGNYFSQVPRSGSGSVNGLEASYGPFQLFTGGGLGNEYEQRTNRSLPNDNTREGVINQIRFALDEAARRRSWTPWAGRGPAGVGDREGLANATPVGNWS